MPVKHFLWPFLSPYIKARAFPEDVLNGRLLTQAEAAMFRNGNPCFIDSVLSCLRVCKKSYKGDPYVTIRLQGTKQFGSGLHINLGNSTSFDMFFLQLSGNFVSEKFTNAVCKLLLAVAEKGNVAIRKLVLDNTCSRIKCAS